MTNIEHTSRITLSLICYPYYPSRDTGRGHDRYIAELKDNISSNCSQIHLRLLEQGFSKGVLGAGAKLFKLIIDLLHVRSDAYHAISPVGGALAAVLGKSPLAVTIHDLIPFNVSGYDYSWKYWFLRLCIKLSVKRADAVIVPYKVTKEELVSRFNVRESKIHVVNYGVDHTTYYPRSSDLRSHRQVLYIGEVSRSKGVDILLRAFSIVKNSIHDAALLIGGKKSKDQLPLEHLAHEIGSQGVTFLGYIPEDKLPVFYSSATVMIFPSRCGFGLSTLEAMACGTPVIVGAVLDAPEFIGDSGILIDPNSTNELAESIVRVLTSQVLREELSKKATERARSFSWEKMANETCLVYTNVMRRPTQSG